MKKKTAEHDESTQTSKMTVRIPKALLLQAKVRALTMEVDLQDLVAAALTEHLKTQAKPGRGNR